MEENSLIVSDFNKLEKSESSTKMSIYTTIDPTDVKTLYNLDNSSCDYKLVDCKGQSMRIVNVLIKNFDKYKDENGEELETPENKKITILIDDQGKTYVTASKIFAIQMLRFIARFGNEAITNGLDIKITEKDIKGSKNKGLGFELI